MNRGFTLLEVLVAVAILGLGLTVILSSQAGLFSGAGHAQHLSIAANLLRCRMNETELELLQKGFPLIDESEEGPCCDVEEDDEFSCEWRVETIELPQPAGLEAFEGDDSEEAGTDSLSTTGAGPLGALMEVQATKGASLGENPDIGSLAETLGGGEEGMQGMASMVMGLVYPSLKPMLEASIRKVIVTVRWKEGSNEREISATQYLTRPQQGGFDPNAAEGLEQLAEQVEEGSPTQSTPARGAPALGTPARGAPALGAPARGAR